MPPSETSSSRVPRTFWVLLIGLPGFFFAAMTWLDGQPLAEGRWWVEQADGIMSESSTPPGADASWEHVTLREIYKGQSRERSSVWWRIPLAPEVRSPGRAWMVVIPFPMNYSRLSLWLGDRLYESRGHLGLPASMLRNPQSFSIVNPPDAETPPLVFIRIETQTSSIGMSPVLVGPAEELRRFVTIADAVQRLAPQTLIAMMLLMSAITGSVYLLRGRNDPVFGWYALLLLIWTAHIGHAQNERPPFGDADLWIAISRVTLGWFVITASFFVNSILDVRERRVERALLLWGVAGTLIHLLYWAAGASSRPFNDYLWMPSLVMIGGYLSVRLLRAVRSSPSADTMGLMFLASFLTLAGARDYLVSNLQWLHGNFLYLRLAAGSALLVFAVLLIRRFAVALDTAETLNQTLELRIRDKSKELDAQYERTREIERQQLVVSERQRLLREMHDGLGGHLVHALASAENDASLHGLVPQLRMALEDLRLIIDSLDPDAETFESVFVSLRARIARSAASLDMALHWEMNPRLADLEMNAHEILTLARVVQEAVTNVIKHAKAKTLTIRSSFDEATGRAEIAVVDDGAGIPDDHADGRGLTSMRVRASELGGTLDVVPLHPGTRVRLTWHPTTRHTSATHQIG